MLNVTDALKRALRTAAQTFIASGVVTSISGLKSLADIKVAGTAWATAAVMAVAAGLLSLIQNVAEDNTKLPALGKPLAAPPAK